MGAPTEKALRSPPEQPIITMLPDKSPSRRVSPDWQAWFNDLLFKIFKVNSYSVTHDPANILAGVEAQQVITVTGLRTNSVVVVNKPTKTAGLILSDAHVSASDQLTFTLYNFSGGAINAAEEVYRVVEIRL